MKPVKFIITAALALLLGVGASAQENTVFGLKAGAQGNWIPGTFIDANDRVIPNFGFYGGAFVMRSFSDFLFGQVEVLYSRKGVTTKKEVLPTEVSTKYTRTIHYIQVPVLFGMKFAYDRLYLMIGPELGYSLGTQVRDGSVIPDPSSMGKINPFYLWLDLQSTFWLTDALGIDLKADFGLTRVFKDAKVGEVADRGRNLSIQLGLSYRFGY